MARIIYRKTSRKSWKIAIRATAVFFSWSTLGIVIYGLFTLRFDLLVLAAIWYFACGGMMIQNLRDAEEEFGNKAVQNERETRQQDNKPEASLRR